MTRTTFSLLILLAFIFGCSHTPLELRNLSSVTITVVNDGRPLEGVEVILQPRQPMDIWACSGRTNGSGVAVVETTLRTHTASGARAGTYAVVLHKTPELPPELKPTTIRFGAAPTPEEEALNAKRAEFLSKNRVIPVALESETTTPIELTVTEKTSATLTIDVAKY